MAFNANDVNYQAYLAVRARLDGNFAENFDQAFIEYLCAQATATGTINSAMVSSALTLARSTALARSADVLKENDMTPMRNSHPDCGTLAPVQRFSARPAELQH